MKSRIGELVAIRTKRLKVIAPADWNKCAWGRELNQLLLETHEIEEILNPHGAQKMPEPYECEYNLSNKNDCVEWAEHIYRFGFAGNVAIN